jgi:hypothetical protein
MRKHFSRLLLPAVSVACLLLSDGGCANRGMQPPSQAVSCSITRDECIAESLGPNGAQCDTFLSGVTITGTICSRDTSAAALNAACTSAFCNRANANPLANYDYPNCSATGALADPQSLPAMGACTAVSSSTSKASIAYQIHQHECVVGEGHVCTSLTDISFVGPQPPDSCSDLSKVGAVDTIKPTLPPNSPPDVPTEIRDGVVQLFQVIPNDHNCDIPASALTAYELTPGPLGQATAAGTTVPFSMTRGFATFNGASLNDLSINIADLTVAGTRISNALVTNTFPARLEIGDPDNPSHTGIAAGNLRLRVIGLVGGVPQIYNLHNDTRLDLIVSSTMLKLSGTFNFTDVDQNGKPLPVKVTFTMPGTPATPATKACATASPRDRLFGFEDPQSWSSTVATLSLVTSPVTQGCGALGIAGQGYMPINSSPFDAAGLPLKSAVSVDLFIPNNQPNQFYLGALQMYLTCPSVNAFNEYIGQVELTGKPQNAFSTLRFPLPSQVTSTLRQAPSDCSWGFALNANPTNRTWILDNLRFTN